MVYWQGRNRRPIRCRDRNRENPDIIVIYPVPYWPKDVTASKYEPITRADDDGLAAWSCRGTAERRPLRRASYPRLAKQQTANFL
jgi:hypothetical protein